MGFVVLCQMKGSAGLRIVIDREECFSHDAKYEGDTVHVSFVVIKIDSSWHYTQDGVDLVVWSIFRLYCFILVIRDCKICLVFIIFSRIDVNKLNRFS